MHQRVIESTPNINMPSTATSSVMPMPSPTIAQDSDRTVVASAVAIDGDTDVSLDCEDSGERGAIYCLRCDVRLNGPQ
eukprot:8270857-Lingulodinium_polyedra.AAC.1